ncbi:DUF3795 domain-containing protein [candidate division KSB1 bacterium]|nr:DUF3795 domain-containing protein [candidate division KSB1 bacterium]
MSIMHIGCCGAYCGTCPVMKDNLCKGCKLGYDTGERDISKAKCKMKVCCLTKGLITCADCKEYDSCEIINNFHSHNGYKYKKYREAIDFIRAHSYDEFLEIASQWKRQYGAYPKAME